MYLTVTEEDIARGVPTDGSACPVARALKRELEPDYVFVSPDGIELVFETKDTGTIYLDLPATKPMTSFIDAFDSDGQVQPSRFRLLGI